VRGVVIAGAIPVVGLTVVEASNTEFKLRRVDHKLGAECPPGDSPEDIVNSSSPRYILP